MKTVPQTTRPPAVAGMFYPRDPRELKHAVTDMLAAAAIRGQQRQDALGAIVPHAGLMYSGACAARVFSRIRIPDTVVVLGPSHHGFCAPGGASLWPEGVFSTPMGDVGVDEAFCEELLSTCELVSVDREAHLPEHAIELELPFLAEVAPETKIVPLLVVPESWEFCRDLAEALAALAGKRSGNIVILASSDMTHFEPADLAQKKDRLALDTVERFDGAELLRVCRRERITMCGRVAAAIVLEVTKALGAAEAEVVDYRHSGLVTGDFNNVVAYAGVVIA